MSKRPEELDDPDRHEVDGSGYTAGSVTFNAADVSVVAGGFGILRYAVIYNEQPRTWRERLFSWPWRPWVKYRPPLAVIDMTAGVQP